MSKCYQLIGIPGSGKSTWIKNQIWAKECVTVSTDYFVELEAKRIGKTYSEVFKEFMPIAVEMMTAVVIEARNLNKDIIWDQTSTTIFSRKKKFSMLPNYDHIAVVFQKPDNVELLKRLSNRPGKVIPWDVVTNMINGYEPPTLDEGFIDIWYAS